jgi:drug/metabolite transporter (DMT)-like permease
MALLQRPANPTDPPLMDSIPSTRRPAAWTVAVAFALLYLSWGTTFFAIREGVHTYLLPPALFGGVRVSLAGWLLLGYLWLRGKQLRMPMGEFIWVVVAGLLLFVGGNGLLNVAMETVPSGVGSLLGATTPIWMALLEMLWPWGERLTLRGWIGLVVGLGGVLILMTPRLQGAGGFVPDQGHLVLMGSSVTWALGSLIVRYRRGSGSHLVVAAYQMIAGGSALAFIGLAMGEFAKLTPDKLVPGAAVSFLYLLVVGSLVGFVDFNWLLGQVPAALVGTYAYVNPLVAVLVGYVLGGEEITGWIAAGMVVILGGVALLRGAAVRPSRAADQSPYRATRREIALKACRSLTS